MRTRITGFLAVLGLLCAGLAAAQQPAPSIVESVGTASVYGAPNRAEFWLHYEVRGQDLSDAAAQAMGFEDRLENALAERAIVASSVEISPISLPAAGDTMAAVSAMIRVGLAAYASQDTGVPDFAALCDKIAEMAQALGCRTEGPFFSLSDPKLLERQAVARATADAYATAEAIANEMSSVITAVETVSIVEVRWNSDPARRAPLPNLREAACTATVRVVYVVTAT